MEDFIMKKFLLIAAAAVLSFSALYAAPWASHNSRRRPKSLLVVGNYKTPRLMAETIRSLTKQPYLLVSNDGRFFIFMSRDIQEVPAGKLDVYINLLNPKRLVIIGDERYVSDDVERKLRTINLRRIPIMRIYGENWLRVAEELDDLLNIGNLKRNFYRNNFEMEMRDPRLRNPEPEKSEKVSEAPAAENTADAVPSAEPVAPAAENTAAAVPTAEPVAPAAEPAK